MRRVARHVSAVTVVLVLLACAWAFAAAPSAAPDGAKPARTGRFQVTFEERSPLGAPEVLYARTDRFGTRREISDEERRRVEYDIRDKPFDVCVSAGYKPDKPYGLFVWVGMCDVQNVWMPVLAKHKLIMAVPVGVREMSLHLRQTLSLDAVHNLSKQYNIDPRRVYVAGFSAGGAIAADLLRAYPEVFSGVCCFMGGEFYACPEDANGKSEPSSAEDGVPWQCPIEDAKRDAKIVLMRGGKDRMRNTAAWGRADAESLRLEGFTRVTYIEIPKWPHFPPTAPWFDRAMKGLEAKPRNPPTTQPTTAAKPHPDQLAQARRLVAGAKHELWMRKQFEPGAKQPNRKWAARFTERARVPLRQVMADYPTTPAAKDARALLEQLDAEKPATTQRQ